MFPFLPPEIQSELAELAQAYGQTLVQTVELEIESLFDPLTKRYKIGLYSILI